MSPVWGEDHCWKEINDCVDMMYKMLGDDIFQAKEKFGYLRVYVSKLDVNKYRAAYKTCIDKYPDHAKYIMAQSDYPEHLEGLVDKDNCDHSYYYESKEEKRCTICYKDLLNE